MSQAPQITPKQTPVAGPVVKFKIGNNSREIKLESRYLKKSDANRLFQENKVVEIAFAILSEGIPLLRTEGVGDVTLLEISTQRNTYTVPAILPEKIQAKLRRVTISNLREYFNMFDKQTREDILKKYSELGFKKNMDMNTQSWNCYIAPPKEAGETDEGLCGYCPSCNLYGTILSSNEIEFASTTYGIKSRVLNEIAFATTPQEKAVIDLTHNKVGDGLSHTGMSLFTEPHVAPGVVFIGKIALYEVTERELKLVLSALSSITRMGAGETKYGKVKVIPLGIKEGSREDVSSYEIAVYVLEKLEEVDGGEIKRIHKPEEVISKAIEYLKSRGFKIIEEYEKMRVADITVTLEDLTVDFYKSLWLEDNYYMAKSVSDFIKLREGVEKAGKKRR